MSCVICNCRVSDSDSEAIEDVKEDPDPDPPEPEPEPEPPAAAEEEEEEDVVISQNFTNLSAPPVMKPAPSGRTAMAQIVPVCASGVGCTVPVDVSTS